MTPAQAYVIAVIGLPLALIGFNRVRVDVGALLIALLLAIGQYAGLPIFTPTPDPARATAALMGFGQPVILTLISLFVLAGGLEKYGVAGWLAGRIIALGGSGERRLIFLFALGAAVLSLVMNNLAAGALLIPSAIDAARRVRLSPSRLLMPIAFGTLLGGSATYFTTANIIASGLLLVADPPQTPLNVLSFAGVGGLTALVGLAYLGLFAPRFLPARAGLPEVLPQNAIQPLAVRPAIFLSLITGGAVLIAVLGAPTWLAVFGGMILALLSGLIGSAEAYQWVEWRAIFLIAGMYPASLALTSTGIAAGVGQAVLAASAPFGGLGLAAGVYLITVALTQIMGGQVTALITGPVAIAAAIQAGISPQAMAVTVALACNCAYLTPFAHAVNVMVSEQGAYRFADYTRLGIGLTGLSFIALLVGLRLFWGL